MIVKPTGCGFDPHSRRWNIYLHLYFYFLALMSRQSAALSSATQHAMPPDSAESEERSVSTLGSLCLPYCVRYTAWSWFILFHYYYLTIYSKYEFLSRHSAVFLPPAPRVRSRPDGVVPRVLRLQLPGQPVGSARVLPNAMSHPLREHFLGTSKLILYIFFI